MPQRRNAASNTRSATPDGSGSRPPARIATIGRSRAAARAAEMKRAAVADAADVEQDGAGAGVAAEPVQDRGEAEIGIAADADDVAEADAVGLRPVEHGAAQRRRLRDQREPAGPGWQMTGGGVETGAGDDDAERAGSEHAARGGPPGAGVC